MNGRTASTAAALLIAACTAFGCYTDIEIDRHACDVCRSCETCVAVVQGVARCEATPAVSSGCGEGGHVHVFDSCGEDDGVAMRCLNGSRCSDGDGATPVCACTQRWEGEDCGRCPGGFDPTQGCGACRNGWSGADCDVCEAGFAPASNCSACRNHWTGPSCDQCPAGFDAASDCASCAPRFTGAACDQCVGHWDEALGCSACRPPWTDAANDCSTCAGDCGAGQVECHAGQFRACISGDGCNAFAPWQACADPTCSVCASRPGQPPTHELDCFGVWGGTARRDGCGTCDADPDNDCRQDCAGAWGGRAYVDRCGRCDAMAANDCMQDCAGVWGGAAYEDLCGTCDTNTGNDCPLDCAGVWGGSAYADDCGVCDANTSNDDSTCSLDCAGVWGGSAYVDRCGECDAYDGNDCRQDCAGVWGGAAYRDQCGACDANPGNDCVQDCAGVWGGAAYRDPCGTCDANAGNDCVRDCAGVWGGLAYQDECGTCDANAGNDCKQDCAGTWGGSAYEDDCGVCDAIAGNDEATCSSCVGTAPRCSDRGRAVSCCIAPRVPGGTFPMGRSESGSDACVGVCGADELPEHDVTVSSYFLDAFEVTVGRFRAFKAAYQQGWRPQAGQGSHPRIPGTGWQSAWDDILPGPGEPMPAADACHMESTYSTWTELPGANEQAAINCISWYEAFAFCIWDRKRLATEAEWEIAAAGGDENRLFPWGSEVPTSGGPLAYYGARDPTLPVGSHAQGRGRFGHHDLAGGMWEHIFDVYDAAWYSGGGANCVDCANTNSGARMMRSSNWQFPAWDMQRATDRLVSPPTASVYDGIRCAHSP